MRHRLALPGLLLLLAAAGGCMSVNKTVGTVKADTTDQPVSQATATTGQKVGGAVTAPLHDVNLVRTKIPPILMEAKAAPYAQPKPLSCEAIKAAIEPLDAVLGPDVDKPRPAKTSKTKQDEAAAGDAAIDTLKSASEDLIPFRGGVRLLTGAERHDRKVREAILAGEVRRAYLKGVGLEHRCRPPAAPLADALKWAPPELETAADEADDPR